MPPTGKCLGKFIYHLMIIKNLNERMQEAGIKLDSIVKGTFASEVLTL